MYKQINPNVIANAQNKINKKWRGRRRRRRKRISVKWRLSMVKYTPHADTHAHAHALFTYVSTNIHLMVENQIWISFLCLWSSKNGVGCIVYVMRLIWMLVATCRSGWLALTHARTHAYTRHNDPLIIITIKKQHVFIFNTPLSKAESLNKPECIIMLSRTLTLNLEEMVKFCKMWATVKNGSKSSTINTKSLLCIVYVAFA